MLMMCRRTSILFVNLLAAVSHHGEPSKIRKGGMGRRSVTKIQVTRFFIFFDTRF